MFLPVAKSKECCVLEVFLMLNKSPDPVERAGRRLQDAGSLQFQSRPPLRRASSPGSPWLRVE